MNVVEMLKAKILEMGGEGLVDTYNECGCKVDDLAPCGQIGNECEVAKEIKQENTTKYYFFMEPIIKDQTK